MIPERQDFITLTGVHSGNYVYYQDYIDLYMAAEKQEQQIKELKELLTIAKCPDCDGVGEVISVDSNGFANGYEQCRFCDEVEQALKK